MLSDGQLFKKLRCSRGISQKDICSNQLSRTTLSKFENDKVNLSFSNFKYLLNSIDISLEEFEYIKNGYSCDQKAYIINSFDQIFSVQCDEMLIKELIEFIEVYLIDNYSKSVYFILDVLKSFQYIKSSGNDKVDCKAHMHIADLWKDMSEIESWSLLDIKLINSSLYFFEYATCIDISKQLINSLNKYKNYKNISGLEISIYLNVTLLALMNNDIETAKKFSEIALDKSVQSNRLDYISISLVRKGIAFNSKKDSDKGLKLIELSEKKDILSALRKEINDFKLKK